MRRLLLILPLLFLAACGRHYSWHQKLTLVVETPTGVVTGSAVTEIRAVFYKNPPPLAQTEVTYDVTGEAVVVEVAPGRYLFALIGNPSELFHGAARDRFAGMRRGEWLYDIPKQTEPVELKGRLIPTLVTFGDITKPETVREVDPDDLEATFGPGVSLTSAILEITEEPVTAGWVDQLLPWLGPYPEPHLIPGDGRTSDIPFGMLVAQGDFIRR